MADAQQPGPSRRELGYLVGILLAARAAQAYVAGLTWPQFQADELRQDAVVRRLEVLGEAARRISEVTRAALPTLPWRQMIGMRNRIIHEYERVDLPVVWDTVQNDLAPLIAALEAIVPPEGSTE